MLDPMYLAYKVKRKPFGIQPDSMLEDLLFCDNVKSVSVYIFKYINIWILIFKELYIPSCSFGVYEQGFLGRIRDKKIKVRNRILLIALHE